MAERGRPRPRKSADVGPDPVAATDSPALPLNATLTASGDPLANDFYFLDV